MDSPPFVRLVLWANRSSAKSNWRAQFLHGNIVAITGSNGKTTTTTLAGEIVAAGGFPTWSAAISARRLSRWLSRRKAETVVVLEVSSFQLETIQTFRPKIAVVLNITPDHLDRHRTFAAYTTPKPESSRISKLDDFAVLNADDPTPRELAGRTRAKFSGSAGKKKSSKALMSAMEEFCFAMQQRRAARDHAGLGNPAEGRA